MGRHEQEERRPFVVTVIKTYKDGDGNVCDLVRSQFIVTAVDWQDALARGEVDGVLVTTPALEPTISVSVEPIGPAEYDRLFQAAAERVGQEPVERTS